MLPEAKEPLLPGSVRRKEKSPAYAGLFRSYVRSFSADLSALPQLSLRLVS